MNRKKSIKKTSYLFSFTNKIFLILLVFSSLILGGLAGYFGIISEHFLYKNLGNKALVQAKSIAAIPELIQAVSIADKEQIQKIIAGIVKQSDADFIVIGDKHETRLFHTIPDKIGNKMVGGDSNDVLEHKEAIVSITVGSMGLSMRGKAPIIDYHGNTIGIVSVGYLDTHIQQKYYSIIFPIIFVFSGLIILMSIAAWLFSRYIKKQIFNLEPSDIDMLVHKQRVILESIFEGLIVIDLNYTIKTFNKSARKYLDLVVDENELIGKNINEIISYQNFFDDNPINYTQDRYYEIRFFNDKTVIASRIRIIINEKTEGWIITFRDRDNTNFLSDQLSQIKKYVDNNRVIRHEHLNWVATLSGMLALGNYEEAKEFIATQFMQTQEIFDDIQKQIEEPLICGLLLGKYAQAKELGIKLFFDPRCRLTSLPAHIDENELISILGNLLDNAFDAVNKQDAPTKEVSLYLSDVTDEIVIEVADNGCGIDDKIKERIFEWGFTTKQGEIHGVGLYLVTNYVNKIHGYITVDHNEPQGSIFSIFIPKKLQGS